MRAILLGVTAIAFTACVDPSNAGAQTHNTAATKTPRPGASAPNCITLTETTDGCTFSYAERKHRKRSFAYGRRRNVDRDD
jgi:hypothetical protein